jgi:hypothetical protein
VSGGLRVRLGRPALRKGRLRVGKPMSFTLLVDHRPIDRSAATQWMAVFLSPPEEPVRLIR